MAAFAANSWLNRMKTLYGARLLALIALGFGVQGFRCFPWLAVSYHLKDNLKLDPGMLQFLQQSANLPFLAKPVYGLISDTVYIHGAHRVPYLILAGLIQAVSWGTIAFHSTAAASLGTLAFYLTLTNLGVAIGEVANDAMIAEFGKRSKGGELQSFAFLAGSAGALLGNLLAGLALNRLETATIFTLYFGVVGVSLAAACSVSEKSLLPSSEVSAKPTNDRKATPGKSSSIMDLVQRPDIVRPILWCTLSVSVIPSMLGSVFYYQTQVLKLDSFYLGLSKTVGQLGLFLGSMLFNRFLKDVPLRKVAPALQMLLAVSMLLDIFLLRGMNKVIGLSDEWFVVLFSGLIEGLMQLKVLPFMVLLGKICPRGSEATLMAAFSACLCMANLVSGYFGVALASLLGISGANFQALAMGIVLEAALTLLPVFFVSLLPKADKAAIE